MYHKKGLQIHSTQQPAQLVFAVARCQHVAPPHNQFVKTRFYRLPEESQQESQRPYICRSIRSLAETFNRNLQRLTLSLQIQSPKPESIAQQTHTEP